MPSQNALIVEVVGDTSKLTASLNKADKELQRFAGRASSWDKRTPQSGPAGPMLKDIERMKGETDVLGKRLAGMGDEAAAAGTRGAAGMGLIGVAAATAFQAAQRLSAALEVSGDKAATTEGQFRNAGAALLRFDAIGAVLAFNVHKQATSWEEAKQRLDDYTASNRSWANQMGHATHGVADFIDKTENLVGLDPKLNRLTDDFNRLWEAAHPPTTIDFSAIQGTFGVTPLDPLLGKTAAAQRRGTTPTQRNRFFDARIARELDRVQDVKTIAGQVTTLNAIAAEIQNRIDATKDITRKLNLEDQLLAVQRRADALRAGAAKDAADAAAKAAAAERERLRKLREAAAAREQARQFTAIGLGPDGGDVIPRVANLKRQLEQLTSRSDIGSIPSKMRTALRGVSRVLKGEFGKVTSDTRSAIQDLFDAIRDELDKGASGGPLTKTTQLSSRILEGLGLSAADERILRARISHFNSAGTALAGTGTGSAPTFTSYTVIDGRVIAGTSTKYQRRARTVNTAPRNGPSAGGYVGA
jgi:hypothetical protein